MPRQRHRACLQHGIKLDLNRLARQGLVNPGAQTGPFVIRWTNTYWQEEIASGWISADMQREVEGFSASRSANLTRRSSSSPPGAIMVADNGISFARQ